VIEQLLAQKAPAPATPAQAAAAPTAQAGASDPMPTLEQHGYDTAKWAEAHAQWTNRQVEARVAGAMQNVQAQQHAQTAREAFESRVNAFKANVPDFDVVIQNPALPALPAVAPLIVGSEVGPAIVYHLAKNPDLAMRISRMASDQQKVAIGEIIGRLAVAQVTQSPQRRPSTASTSSTQAPPPPSTTRSGASAAAPTDPSKMSMDEFVANERQRAAEKRERLRSRR
jgi:hypothetical protein